MNFTMMHGSTNIKIIIIIIALLSKTSLRGFPAQGSAELSLVLISDEWSLCKIAASRSILIDNSCENRRCVG